MFQTGCTSASWRQSACQPFHQPWEAGNAEGLTHAASSIFSQANPRCSCVDAKSILAEVMWPGSLSMFLRTGSQGLNSRFHCHPKDSWRSPGHQHHSCTANCPGLRQEDLPEDHAAAGRYPVGPAHQLGCYDPLQRVPLPVRAISCNHSFHASAILFQLV